MNEAQSVPQPNEDPATSTYDADGRALQSPDDRLATTRLPPLAPPPRPQRIPSTPPPPYVQHVQPDAQAVAQSYAPVDSNGMGRPAMSSSVHAKTTWWQALFASAPLPSVAPRVSDRVLEKRIGLASAALALVVLVFALAVGLRGAPPLSSRSAMVDAAIVIARALMGLGLLAFGVALLSVGARFFMGRLGGSGARRDDE